MRKVLSVLLSASLLFGIGTSVLAEEKSKVETVEALIINTNLKIENEIAKAVEKADKLRADYLANVRKLEEEGKIELIEDQYLVGINDNVTEEDTMNIIEEKLFIIEDIMFSVNSEDKLSLVEQEVSEITTLLVSSSGSNALASLKPVQGDGNTIEEKYQHLTIKYVNRLNKIITNLQEKAEKMSANTIKKAEEVGIQAVCELVLVRIGHEYVWVDPIRIVGI